VVIIPLDERIKTGVYVKAKIDRATSATLFGEFTGFANLLEEHLSLTG
jgi:hypothetical protein